MTSQIGQEYAPMLKVKRNIESRSYANIYRELLGVYSPIKRPPLPTEIEPKLMAHIDNWFKTCKVRNIPIKTPQMLYMLLQYPDCNILKIFNAIQPDSFFDADDCNGQENSSNPKTHFGITCSLSVNASI